MTELLVIGLFSFYIGGSVATTIILCAPDSSFKDEWFYYALTAIAWPVAAWIASKSY